MIIIFDLDGTLANIEHRRHLVSNGSNRWDEFYAECVNDDVNMPVVNLCKTLYDGEYKIFILSGRSNAVRKETELWLAKNYIKYHKLYMRPEKDYTPDQELKLRWLREVEKMGLIHSVFDDRDKVVKMWREQELTCFQVAEGNF